MMLRKPRRWDGESDDPTSGLVNLFDVWMVFAVALLLALVEAGAIRAVDSSPATTESPGRLELVEPRKRRVDRMQITHDRLAGEGERLGIAYRLKSGEVVYVPEAPAATLGPRK